MKSTGLVRRFDDLGRVVIPKEIMRSFNIQEGDPLELFAEDGGIYLRKYEPDYDIVSMVDDIDRKLEFIVEEVGHKNSRDIKLKLKEIKELLSDC